MAVETQNFLYETLSPLGGGGGAMAADSTPSPVSEPYAVFRNEIAMTSVRCPSPDSAVLDYLSLDFDEDAKDEGRIVANPRNLPEIKGNWSPVPWRSLEANWFQANSRIKSPMLRLHKEILEFSDFLSPTPEEGQRRLAAVEAVSDVIKYIWPCSQVEIFGSFKTGLYLPSSDIDVVILGSNITSPKIGLQALSRALSCSGIAKKIQVIANARVPIIKFVEKNSGFSFDISFDMNNGPKAAEFIKDAMSKWPPLRPLCLILKIFLQQRELNEVYTGGIGSYALLSMLIATFMVQKDCHGSPDYNLGVLLVNFFDIYGRKLNATDVGVSCNGGGEVFFRKMTKGFASQPNRIAIEDPQASDNDIGKSSFNYFKARSAFAMAFAALTDTKAIMRLGPDQSILGAIIRPDAVLLERKGESKQTKSPDYYYDHREAYSNRGFDDEVENPLPRGGAAGTLPVVDGHCSGGTKRKITPNRKNHFNSGSSKANNEHSSNGSSAPSKKKPRWRNNPTSSGRCRY